MKAGDILLGIALFVVILVILYGISIQVLSALGR